MLGGFLFTFWRICEFVTLIPIVGMLAWFVNGYVQRNLLTPNSILILFITSVLASAWVVGTMVRMSSTRRNALFVAFVDLLFVGAFVASDYYISPIGSASCGNFPTSSIYYTLGPYGYSGRVVNDSTASDLTKNCNMLKACYAFSIMNTIFFFFTFILALFLHRNRDKAVVEKRRTVRRRSGSGRSRSGSRTRRSSSRQRSYYV